MSTITIDDDGFVVAVGDRKVAVVDKQATLSNMLDMANAEIERLKALIREAEGVAWRRFQGEDHLSCPWCNRNWPVSTHPESARHAGNCRAFSAPGVVR